MSILRRIGSLHVSGSKARPDILGPRPHTAGTGGRLHRNRARALPVLELLEDRMLLSVYQVTSNSDLSQPGTLRYAINAIDVGLDQMNFITFKLPGGENMITPGTSGQGPLPAITKPVVIEGSTQPGFSGAPLVQIAGADAGFGATGLDFEAGAAGSAIQSVVIDEFTGWGIVIRSSAIAVTSSYIGTDVSTGKRCQEPLLTLPAPITYSRRTGTTSSRRRGRSKLRTFGNELTPDSSLRKPPTFHRVRTDYLGSSDRFLAYSVMPNHFHLLLWQKRAAGGKRGRDSYSSGFDGFRVGRGPGAA
jgi:hypothetical protein